MSDYLGLGSLVGGRSDWCGNRSRTLSEKHDERLGGDEAFLVFVCDDIDETYRKMKEKGATNSKQNG